MGHKAFLMYKAVVSNRQPLSTVSTFFPSINYEKIIRQKYSTQDDGNKMQCISTCAAILRCSAGCFAIICFRTLAGD
jgi:hypothetical protein